MDFTKCALSDGFTISMEAKIIVKRLNVLILIIMGKLR